MEIDALPWEIALNIFSRLPADSVIRCGSVCKSWRALFLLSKNDPYFINMHLLHLLDYEKSNNKLCFLLMLDVIDSNRKRLWSEFDHIVEYDLFDKSYTKIKRMDNYPQFRNVPPWSCDLVLVGSCNGLVCMAETDYGMSKDIADPIYVFNPVNGEYVYLPRSNENLVRSVASGFGYVPTTREYKVIRISYRAYGCKFFPIERVISSNRVPEHIQDGCKNCQPLVQVYTIGNDCGTWKTIKSSPTRGILYGTQPGVLVNGALHWITDDNEIVKFDLAVEAFHVVKIHQHLYDQLLSSCASGSVFVSGVSLVLSSISCSSVQTHGGGSTERSPCSFINNLDKQVQPTTQHEAAGTAHLCLTVRGIPEGVIRDVWALKEYYMSMDKLGSWIKLFSLPILKIGPSYRNVYGNVMKGEIRIYCDARFLDTYDPETRNTKLPTAVDLSSKIRHTGHDRVALLWYYTAVRHINSFVSLKALGERNLYTDHSPCFSYADDYGKRSKWHEHKHLGDDDCYWERYLYMRRMYN